MGQLMQTELVVATLNYSGILLSPFEFYSEQYEKIESQLSRIFQGLMKETFPQYSRATFKWELGKIDQKMQKERYTPIYRENAGIEDDHLITAQQFKRRWDQEFEFNIKNFPDLQYKMKNKERAREFDLICYRTIYVYLYNEKDLINPKDKPIAPYQKFMEEMFNKAFLNEEKKIDKTLKAIDKEEVDVIFLQESNSEIGRAFDKKLFKIITSKENECMIVLRKSKFKTIYDQNEVVKALGDEVKDELTWNKDICLAFADNLILVCAHLSSKKQKQQPDREKMLAGCEKLLAIYPNSHLIVGADANQFLKTVPSALHLFPTKASVNTAYKKRTMMQPQVHKAQEEIAHCIDFLLTDLNMRKPKVVSILGKDANSVGYLPCQEHPYDHFVVTANIYVNEQ